MQVPDKLKMVTSFIRRGEELDRDHTNPDGKVVAFYCKKFALEKALKDGSKDPELRKFLVELMGVLEKAKSELQVTPEQAKVTCENFAHSGNIVFILLGGIGALHQRDAHSRLGGAFGGYCTWNTLMLLIAFSP
jgi:Vta1 like